jgi:hypothetical protein
LKNSGPFGLKGASRYFNDMRFMQYSIPQTLIVGEVETDKSAPSCVIDGINLSILRKKLTRVQWSV